MRSFLLAVSLQARFAALAEGTGPGSNTELFVIRLGQKNYLDVLERAIIAGDTVLLENIDESVDPVLDPVVGRNTIKKGRAVRLGDREVEYNPKFRLILHTKLANPHYKVLSPLAQFYVACILLLLQLIIIVIATNDFCLTYDTTY